jgi:DNA-binding XRE family transcriptional regulator
MKEKKHDILQKQAKERMTEGKNQHSPKVNLPEGYKGQTRDKMAAAVMDYLVEDAKKRQREAIVKGNKTRHEENPPVVETLPQLVKEPPKKARERQKRKPKSDLPVNLPEGNKGDTRDKMAAEIGISGKTYDALAKVNKKGIPEIVAAVRNKHVGAATAAKIADLSESEQLELMSEGEQEIVKKFNEKQKPKKKGVEKKRNLGRKPDYEVAMKYARMAVAQLECIYHNHHDRDQAFDYVIKWINNNRTGRK